MIPIRINDNTYTSIAAAWRELSPEGLTLSAVRWRLRQDWPVSDAVLYATVPPENRRTFKQARERGRGRIWRTRRTNRC